MDTLHTAACEVHTSFTFTQGLRLHKVSGMCFGPALYSRGARSPPTDGAIARPVHQMRWENRIIQTEAIDVSSSCEQFASLRCLFNVQCSSLLSLVLQVMSGLFHNKVAILLKYRLIIDSNCETAVEFGHCCTSDSLFPRIIAPGTPSVTVYFTLPR